MQSYFNGQFLDETKLYYEDITEAGKELIEQFIAEREIYMGGIPQHEDYKQKTTEEKFKYIIDCYGFDKFYQFLGRELKQ